MKDGKGKANRRRKTGNLENKERAKNERQTEKDSHLRYASEAQRCMSPSRILSEGGDHHTSRSRDCVVSILSSLDFDSIRFPSVPAAAVETASVDRALSFNLEESVLAISLQFPGFGERYWNLASSTGRFTRSIVRIFVVSVIFVQIGSYLFL
ncbi:hypothetical protein AAC387_Pa03g2990 [Persea americana]